MALLASKGELPKGAVRLTEQEAIHYQWKQIKNWPHIIDVWPFKIGIPSLLGLTAITGIRINNAIRSKLLLRGFGKIVSHYTIALGAVTVAGFSHYMFVTNEILIYHATCPVCIESKAILLQFASSIVYPSVFSMVANCTLANKYGTYRIPYFSDGQGILQLWLKLASPLRKKLLGYIIVNAVATGFVTYSESKSLTTIRTKLLEEVNEMNEAYIESPETDALKKTPNESLNEKK